MRRLEEPVVDLLAAFVFMRAGSGESRSGVDQNTIAQLRTRNRADYDNCLNWADRVCRVWVVSRPSTSLDASLRLSRAQCKDV